MAAEAQTIGEVGRVASVKQAVVRRHTLFTCAMFILSGACGLAYEVVWTRYLGLFLGNTVLLHMAVLGAFMGGLAGGSFLLGSRADRVKSPLAMYGWLELAIAAYAIIFPGIAGAAQGWVVDVTRALPPGSPMAVAFKVFLAGALLMVPTLLMGATFPALTAHLHRCVKAGTTGANWLYFANCAGAVAGTLITGFYLIPELGLSGTAMAVAIVNIVIGGGAVMVSRSDLAATAAPAPRSAAVAAAAQTPTRKLVLAAICLSGATAFIYEMVWTRIFAVTLGSSTYSFTLMLAAFITGLALGSIAANMLPGIKRAPLTWLAGAEILIGLGVALSIPVYERLPYFFWIWKWTLRPVAETLGAYHLFQYGLTFLVMAVPTFLFGLTFPTAIRAASSTGEDDVSAEAAAVYGWNTVGTLLGVVAAGVVLIPMVGLRATLQFAAVCNVLIGLAVLLNGSASGAARKSLFAVAAIAVIAVFAAPRWHPLSLSYGAFRNQAKPPADWATFKKLVLTNKLLYYKEDHGTTVAVLQEPPRDNRPGQTRLVVDGKTDATSHGDLPTQLLLAQVPLMLRPHAKDVFVLGLGSGVTVGSALTHPVERVDAVELSRAVVEASGQFARFNRNALKDPRVHLTVDDGKTVLAAAPRKYDLIVSEPTNPWISGVGNLFSEEFFRTAEGQLKPDGILCQWFHAYELNDALVATIVRTYRRVFPHVLIFEGSTNDYIMIGSREPLTGDFAAMAERMARPEVAEDLARIGIRDLAALLSRQTHTSAAVDALLEQDGRQIGGVNTDDFPVLEFLAPHSLYTRTSAELIKQTDRRLTPGSGLLIEQHLAQSALTRVGHASILDTLFDERMENAVLRYRLVGKYLQRWPDDAVNLLRLARVLDGAGRPEDAIRYARRAADLGSAEGAEFVQQLAPRATTVAENAFTSRVR
ncbi:MAG: hypothetical protein ACO1SX_07695 [Actinomycetota bacterium]